jgi:hypothetical protein
LQEVSKESARSWYSEIPNKILDPSFTSMMFPCSIRKRSKGQEGSNNNKGVTYLDGTMSVTVRRDLLGLPLLFLGTFLPTIVASCGNTQMKIHSEDV